MATNGVLNKRVEKLYKYHEQAETLVKQHNYAKTEKSKHKEIYEGN